VISVIRIIFPDTKCFQRNNYIAKYLGVALLARESGQGLFLSFYVGELYRTFVAWES